MTALQWKFARNIPAKLNSYSKSEIVHALKANYDHPVLTERLANLRKAKVNICSFSENPWYAEMQTFGITEPDVKILSEFFAFRDVEKKRELKAYALSGRGSYMVIHQHTIYLPPNIRNNYRPFI